MKQRTLKWLSCVCGEEVYENDYGNDPHDGFVWCINCGQNYRIEELGKFTAPKIREIK